MQRRVEAQFRRDWTFGFAVWNYLFRTAVNLQKNAYMFSAPDADGGGYHSLKPEEIVAGAQELARRLNGTYTDVNGGEKPVRGDLTKLRFANLQPAARKILANVEARAANIPGTHEVRKTMRLQTHAYRVCYGTSIFLTFSPSERDTALMLRLARVREEDPALLRDGAKKFQARGAPALDEEFCRLSPEALAESLPNYEDRRALLARDPLACAEGFRTGGRAFRVVARSCGRPLAQDARAPDAAPPFGGQVLPALPQLRRFGAAVQRRVREQLLGHGRGVGQGRRGVWLHRAPKERNSPRPFASVRPVPPSARVAGRPSGLGQARAPNLAARYASYTAHVRRSVCDPDGWERDRVAVEEEWPEYKDCALMLSRPAYQASRRLQPEEWTRQYLAEDVEQLQRRKQHHVHLPAGPSGERRPLAHCRDPKDPTRCKSGFPHNNQLILGRTALVCRGLAEQLDLPVKGKRSSLGLQWGPVNDANLNGNHPALLAALRCNGDLQVPYRFPVTIRRLTTASSARKRPASATATSSCSSEKRKGPRPGAGSGRSFARRCLLSRRAGRPSRLRLRLHEQAAAHCRARAQGVAEGPARAGRGVEGQARRLCGGKGGQAVDHRLLRPQRLPRRGGVRQPDHARGGQRPHRGRVRQDGARPPDRKDSCDLASSSWTRPPPAKGRPSSSICGRICGRALAWSPAPSGRSMARGGAPRKSMTSAPSSSRATSASSKPSGPSLWRQ